jgi:hypothetical protein
VPLGAVVKPEVDSSLRAVHQHLALELSASETETNYFQTLTGSLNLYTRHFKSCGGTFEGLNWHVHGLQFNLLTAYNEYSRSFAET